MSTFQAIIYSIVQGFSEFLPIGSHAHRVLVPYLLGWSEPSGAFMGALSLGSLLALLIYFRHDWASIFSAFLQLIAYRKKPMTLDERLPFFIFISMIPAAIAWHYSQAPLAKFYAHPLWLAGGMAAFGLPLVFADSLNRKNKNMFDWTLTDALAIGIGQACMFLPGAGRLTTGLTAASSRNYAREAATKYVYYASLPFLVGATYLNLKGVHLHSTLPAQGLSLFTFVVTVVVTAVCGILAIGGLVKGASTKNYWGYAFYRITAGAVVAIIYWMRNR